MYHGTQAEDSSLCEYLTFHLESCLLTLTLLMIEVSFTTLGWVLVSDFAGLVCRGKKVWCYHVLNFVSAVCFQLKLVD